MTPLFGSDVKTADIYVDLGTANILIAVRGQGLVVNEPALIAYSESRPGKKKVVAVGREAQEKIQQSPGNLRAERPLREGVIADFETAEALLKHFLQRLKHGPFMSRPRLVVSMPFGVTEVEKRAVVDAGKAAGAKEVVLIDEPMAAAIGAELPIRDAKGSLIVDIGGGTTEVAVIALADIVACTGVRIGGHAMDAGIQSYLRRQRNFLVTDRVAERLKIELGTAIPKKDIRTLEVDGRNADSGAPVRMEISSQDIGLAIDSCLSDIIRAIHDTLEKTPPELVSDVIEEGLVLAGGGALIRNLDLRIQNEVRLPVRIAHDPLLTIARGGEKLLSDPDLLDKIQLEM
ncbi:MAG: rod shape-determining protein [Bdellovibrio sp.]|nr:MAG: rod shape-determining protein [Bdellovibrio sp.]